MSDVPRLRVLLGIAGVIAVLLAAVLLRLTGGMPVGSDAGWQGLMASHRWAAAEWVAQALATVGSSAGAAVVTGAVVIFQLFFRRWRAAIALTLAVSLGAIGSTAIKLVSARPRPLGGGTELTTFSFPSGHTTWAAAFAASMALSLPRVWSWVLAGAWITLMAGSRTYLGVHWLSDVAAGALLGISLALILTGLVTRLFIRFGRVHGGADRIEGNARMSS